jgi:2-polyprenyl-3-methyl-5-hydroxy-6-metoxy-1,4-benzoquinol methylase
MDQLYLKSIREYEAGLVAQFLPARGSLLEIGAGSGWQAKMLQEAGYQVSAIELPDSSYLQQAVFPILNYDGRTIPFADQAFDIVFSSNVLEHIAQVEAFQSEIYRVCRPGGTVIHVLPTPSWRFWTSVTHYIHTALFPYRLLRKQTTPEEKSALQSQTVFWQKMIRILIPKRHGETGNFISEFYLFSKQRWLNLFSKTGFEILGYYPVHTIHTGFGILGKRLSLDTRKRLGGFLGSAAAIYVLKRPAANP